MIRELQKPDVMKTSRFYFDADSVDAGADDELRCHPLKHHQDMLAVDGKESIRLYPAQMITGNGDFYCIEFGFWGQRGEHHCGRACEAYTPRNGKNGRCKFSKNLYDYLADEAVLLKVDGSLVEHAAAGTNAFTKA